MTFSLVACGNSKTDSTEDVNSTENIMNSDNILYEDTDFRVRIDKNILTINTSSSKEWTIEEYDSNLIKVDKTVPEINQVTRLFADVRNTSDIAVERTSDIQGSIEGCAQAMDNTTAATITLAQLAQQLTDATIQFKVE